MPTSSRGHRGALRPWVVVGTVWVTLAIASGLYFSFPVFFVALLDEFGWSRGATAAAFSISSVVQGLLSPVVGILVDRLGPRRIMLGGAGPRRGGGAEPRVRRRGARGGRRAADARVLGALLRLPLHTAGRLLDRHAFGGLRRGPRLSAPVRGGHLRAHRPALGGGPHPVRHRGRSDRAHRLGDHLLRLHGGGDALLARHRVLAPR